MKNIEIKTKIKESRIMQYEIAAKIGISEYTLCRWFRKELTSEQRMQILDAIAAKRPVKFMRREKSMTQEELNMILDKHKKWLRGKEGGEKANLRGAELRRADLRGADLRGADLCRADLRRAELRGADLDYSCWPLWCGSLDVKVDARIARQLAYHFCRLDCDDPEYLEARKAIAKFANGFHRVDECGRIEA